MKSVFKLNQALIKLVLSLSPNTPVLSSTCNHVNATTVTFLSYSYAQQAAMWSQYMEQMGYQMPSQMNHNMVPPAVNHMAAYSPQQYMWMQQMYAQYMANYMQ